MSDPRLELIQLTRRTAAIGRDALVRQGVMGSLAAHSLVATLLVMFGWLNLGALLDPVLPYPPQQDYAAISVPFSGTASQEAARPRRLEVAASAREFESQAELLPADTTLRRPDAAQGELPAGVDLGQRELREPPAEPVLDLEPQVVVRRSEFAATLEEDQGEPLTAAGALSRATAGVDTRVPPRILINPAPHYPREALVQRLAGTVILRVAVAADGRVVSVEIHATSGTPSLDAAAREAVQRWTFLPARDPAAPPRVVNVPIEFLIRRAGE